ncbi:MAG: ABC transporter ATP-binding protein/permease [Pseudomonadales bacterium]|nr:ABC transporter ATP-binding protein/permease [Pseudomonadales bacterium]
MTIATNEPTSLLKEVLGKNQFDDRVDTQADIKTTEALRLIGRCTMLLAEAKWLFSLKFLLQLGLVFPALLLPWMAKIVIDNVILQRPLGETSVAYPPFMNPILNLIEGLDPMGIMLALTSVYAVMLFTIGSRMGGTGAGLLQGQDAATQAENTISAGYSAGGGIWGIAEFMVHVRMTQSITNRVRSRLFHRLTHLPMTVLDDQRIGDSVFRVLYDAPEAPDLAYRVTLTPFFMGLGALISLYILQYSYGAVAPELIWIAWFAVPAAFVTTFPFSGALRRTNQNKRAAGSAATNAMEESITQVGAVQSLGASLQASDRFASSSNQTFLRERYAIAVIIVAASIAGGVFGAAAIYVTILVSDQIIENTMTPGDFAVLLGIYYQIASAAGYYGQIWIKLQETLAAVRRVFFFLDYRSEEDRPDGKRLDNVQESVVLDDVSFNYPDGQRALDGINVELPINKLVAIVGPTGAGKTTLAYLIPALVAPTSGRVLIDGIDMREINVDSLRRHVTYVFQEHVLLSDTIRENLLMANPLATDSDLHEALETAGCKEFIDNLPEGIDTVLGRSGDTLSVGQQQRLSIARGLVRDARILILDEPTAALDPQTERHLVHALEDAAKDRLVVVIAHRLSTIRQADLIIFLEDGKIVDSGSEAELMAKSDGPYRAFVELQQN